jgi:Methylamine utilisation protein MauE
MEMLGQLLARDVLAVAFILTATWKLSHRQEYVRSFAHLRPGFVRRIEPLGRVAVVITELVCASLLVASPFLPSRAQVAGPLLAILLLLIFTVAVIAQPSLSDCGCWTSPVTERASPDMKGPLLARNSILLFIGVVAALPTRGGTSVIVVLSSLAFAAVLAPIILELPQVISVAKYHGGTGIGGARS